MEYFFPVMQEALDSRFCARLYLTHVMETFDADVFFPEFDENVYKLKRYNTVFGFQYKYNELTSYRSRIFG